jgi:hypothetical protein
MKSHSRVESRLPTKSGKYRRWAFDLHDLFDKFWSDRFDIGCIGELRIGHNRCWVRVDENYSDALFAKHAAGLNSRVVKFAGLTDDDWAGADDKNAFNAGIFRHL